MENELTPEEPQTVEPLFMAKRKVCGRSALSELTEKLKGGPEPAAVQEPASRLYEAPVQLGVVLPFTLTLTVESGGGLVLDRVQETEQDEVQAGPVLEHGLPQLSTPAVVCPQEGVRASHEPSGVHGGGGRTPQADCPQGGLEPKPQKTEDDPAGQTPSYGGLVVSTDNWTQELSETKEGVVLLQHVLY